jgi:hypothetical protein
VIDESTESIYLDAAIADSSGPHHRIFALSLNDGTPVPGWPIDVADALRAAPQPFNSRDQNERGALTIIDGVLYVPFGGHFGDCGDYHGWVVGISLPAGGKVISWSTRARGGGIWAPGGISAVGHSLFVATGNTFGASSWSDGEAVLRLAPDLHRSSDKRDYFAPPDWHALDQRDLDLGGTAPLPFTIGNRAFILALGPDHPNNWVGAAIAGRYDGRTRSADIAAPRLRYGRPFADADLQDRELVVGLGGWAGNARPLQRDISATGHRIDRSRRAEWSLRDGLDRETAANASEVVLIEQVGATILAESEMSAWFPIVRGIAVPPRSRSRWSSARQSGGAK